MRRASTVITLLFIAGILIPGAAAHAQRPSSVAPQPGKRVAEPGKRKTPAKSTEGSPTVVVKDGRLTVEVENTPLQWVLEEIAQQARIPIEKARGVGRERITLHFQELPLDEGLRWILTAHDAFFFYGVDTVEKKASATLSVVWVYPKGQGRGIAPVAPKDWASTKEMREQASQSPDAAVRAQAVGALIEREQGQARDVIVQALRDRDEGVRIQALWEALSVGVDIPPDMLAQMAASDPSANVRFLALDSLASDPNVAAIATRALNDSDPFVRRRAEEILTRLSQAGRPPKPSSPNQRR